MGKISELAMIICDLRKAVETINDAAKTLEKMFGGNVEAEIAISPTPTKSPLTLEQVRAVLAEKSRAGHTTQIRSLLQKYGADKLSAIDPANYKALLSDAEGLDDAT